MGTALTSADETELFRQYKNCGTAELRNEIVRRYVYIADIVAKKYTKNNRSYNNGAEYEDIYQVACLGLMYAIERFDIDKGVKFASFATPTIVGEVRKYFRDKGFVMRVPSRLYEVFKKAERIKRSGAGDSVKDMARILGVSESTVNEAYRMGDAAFVRSIENEMIGDGDNVGLADTLGADDNGFLIIENSDFIDYCEKKLKPQEREFVRMRYYEDMNQCDIGEVMGMTQMQVSRFEKKVLKKLRVIYFGD